MLCNYIDNEIYLIDDNNIREYFDVTEIINTMRDNLYYRTETYTNQSQPEKQIALYKRTAEIITETFNIVEKKRQELLKLLDQEKQKLIAVEQEKINQNDIINKLMEKLKIQYENIVTMENDIKNIVKNAIKKRSETDDWNKSVSEELKQNYIPKLKINDYKDKSIKNDIEYWKNIRSKIEEIPEYIKNTSEKLKSLYSNSLNQQCPGINSVLNEVDNNIGEFERDFYNYSTVVKVISDNIIENKSDVTKDEYLIKQWKDANTSMRYRYNDLYNSVEKIIKSLPNAEKITPNMSVSVVISNYSKFLDPYSVDTLNTRNNDFQISQDNYMKLEKTFKEEQDFLPLITEKEKMINQNITNINRAEEAINSKMYNISEELITKNKVEINELNIKLKDKQLNMQTKINELEKEKRDEEELLAQMEDALAKTKPDEKGYNDYKNSKEIALSSIKEIQQEISQYQENLKYTEINIQNAITVLKNIEDIILKGNIDNNNQNSGQYSNQNSGQYSNQNSGQYSNQNSGQYDDYYGEQNDIQIDLSQENKISTNLIITIIFAIVAIIALCLSIAFGIVYIRDNENNKKIFAGFIVFCAVFIGTGIGAAFCGIRWKKNNGN